MLFTALAPLTLLHLSITAKNPYPEIPVLGALLLVLAVGLARAPDPGQGQALVIGLVAGLAWWDQPMLVANLG